MKIISLNGRTKLPFKKTSAAIGIFDGVHLGHRYLIKAMLAYAHRHKLNPVLITFFPHPAHVIKPQLKLGYIISLRERFSRLQQLGVRTCLVVNFTRGFANIKAEDFIKNTLVKQLGVKAVFVGANFRFGKDRAGDVGLFESLASAYGYDMHGMKSLQKDGDVISSTRIRHLIPAGHLHQAARLLGRNPSACGKVVQGSHRGKSLGFPTANVAYDADIVPPKGVYIVHAIINGKKYPALANLGTRPSFDKGEKLNLEVHILDFSRDIYAKHIEVEFLKKIRNEKKFSNPKALIEQIRKDVVVARKFFHL